MLSTLLFIIFLIPYGTGFVRADDQPCRQPVVPLIDSQFENDIELVLKNSPKQKNKCDAVSEILSFQNEIEGLDQKKIITYKKPVRLRSVFKLFANESKEMIDLYSICGGKKGSDQFVKNAILIELSKACITPKPPGSLTFEEATKEASRIAESYKNKSLIKIAKGLPALTSSTIVSYAKLMIKNEMNPYVEGMKSEVNPDPANKFINDLPIWEDMNSKTKIPGYTDTLLTLDTTIQVIEQAYPLIVEEKLKSKLAKESEDVQRKVLSEMKQESKKEFERCILPLKQKVNWNEVPLEKRIESVKKKKQDYCNQSGKCSTNPCEESHYLSGDVTIKDTDAITSCVYSSIVSSLSPLVTLNLENNLKDVPNQQEKIKNFQVQGIKDLKICLNQTYPGYYSGDDKVVQPQYLAQEGKPSFEKVILECAETMSNNIGRNVSREILISKLSSTFKEETSMVAEDILKESYEPCLNRQPKGEVDPAICEFPLTVSSLKKSLEKTFLADFPPPDKRVSEMSEKFDLCMKDKLEQFNNSLSSGKPMSMDELNQDETLANCSRENILAFTNIFTEKTFKEEIASASKSKKISQSKKILLRTPDIQKTAVSCVSHKLESLKRSDEFINFLSSDSNLIELKEQCENQTTAKAVASIFFIEAAEKIKDVEKQKVLSSGSNARSLLLAVSKEIETEYKLTPPSGLKNQDLIEWRIEQGYLSFIAKNPDKTTNMDDYVSLLSKKTEDVAYKDVYKNLMSEMKDPYGQDLKNVFSASCFKKMNTQFWSDLPSPKEKSSMSPITSLAQDLESGLSFFKGISPLEYENKLKEIKNFCSKTINSKTALRSPINELILKGTIYNKIQTDFIKSALESFEKEKAEIEDPFKETKLKFAQYKIDEMKKIFNKFLVDKTSFNNLVFKDGAVLEGAFLDFSRLASKDQAALDLIAQNILNKMFSDHSVNGFSSEFSRINLVAGIGQGGIDKAYSLAADHIGSTFNSIPEDNALKYFNNPENINKALAWNSIPQTDRDKTIDNILQYGILPQIKLGKLDSVAAKKTISSSSEQKHKDVDKLFPGLSTYIAEQGFRKHVENDLAKNPSLSWDKRYENYLLKSQSIIDLNYKNVSSAQKENLKKYFTQLQMQHVLSINAEKMIEKMKVEDKISNEISTKAEDDFTSRLKLLILIPLKFNPLLGF